MENLQPGLLGFWPHARMAPPGPVDLELMALVYTITHTEGGTVYVGSTSRCAKRWGRHRYLLRHGRHHNLHLQRAWNKYGEGAFVFAVVEEVSSIAAIKREQYWLDWFSNRGHTYNMGLCVDNALRGRSRGPLSVQTRRKISVALRGRKHTEKAKRKMSKAALGKQKTEDHKRKIGVAHKGKIVSEATRRKMSASFRAPGCKKHKPYPAFYNERTGEHISVGQGLKALCRTRALDPSNMYNVKNGQQRSYRGWILATSI